MLMKKAKNKKRVVRTVDPVALANSLVHRLFRLYDMNNWLWRVRLGFVEVARGSISTHLLHDQKMLLMSSLKDIEDRWLEALKRGTTSKTLATRNINRLSRESVLESYRQVVLEEEIQRVSNFDDSAFAMILSTTADEPDIEHALLEGEVLPLIEVLAHLKRFGCRHSYKEIRNG